MYIDIITCMHSLSSNLARGYGYGRHRHTPIHTISDDAVPSLARGQLVAAYIHIHTYNISHWWHNTYNATLSRLENTGLRTPWPVLIRSSCRNASNARLLSTRPPHTSLPVTADLHTWDTPSGNRARRRPEALQSSRAGRTTIDRIPSGLPQNTNPSRITTTYRNITAIATANWRRALKNGPPTSETGSNNGVCVYLDKWFSRFFVQYSRHALSVWILSLGFDVLEY